MPRPNNVASCDSKKDKTNRQVKTGLYITTSKLERSFDDCLKPFPFCINASNTTDHNLLPGNIHYSKSTIQTLEKGVKYNQR